MKLVGETTYARGIDLLEGIVAMLTKMTWACPDSVDTG